MNEILPNPPTSPDSRKKQLPPTIGIVRETVEKKKENKLKVKEVIIYCTACSSKFTASKKDENGNIIKQQVCPHTILEQVK